MFLSVFGVPLSHENVVFFFINLADAILILVTLFFRVDLSLDSLCKLFNWYKIVSIAYFRLAPLFALMTNFNVLQICFNLNNLNTLSKKN